MSHRLKCWAENFDAIVSGRKTCEVRSEADRVFKAGELVELTRTDRNGTPTEPLTRVIIAISHVERHAGPLELVGRDERTGATQLLCVLSFHPSSTVRL